MEFECRASCKCTALFEVLDNIWPVRGTKSDKGEHVGLERFVRVQLEGPE